MRFFNFFLAYMVQKYQNEFSPIFYYGKKLKNIRKTPKNTRFTAPWLRTTLLNDPVFSLTNHSLQLLLGTTASCTMPSLRRWSVCACMASISLSGHFMMPSQDGKLSSIPPLGTGCSALLQAYKQLLYLMWPTGSLQWLKNNQYLS